MAGISKARGKAHEKRVAAATGGELVPFSGAGAQKGDVHTPSLFLECKSSARTTADGTKSIGLRKDWLTKMVEQAAREGKPLAALVIHFHGDRHDWAVVRLDALLDLISRVQGLCDSDTN